MAFAATESVSAAYARDSEASSKASLLESLWGLKDGDLLPPEGDGVVSEWGVRPEA